MPRESMPPEASAWPISQWVRIRRQELQKCFADVPQAKRYDQEGFAADLLISRPLLTLIESGKRRIPPHLVGEFAVDLQFDEEDTKRFFAKYDAETAAAVSARYKRAGASSREVIPGVSVAALKRVLEADPEARALVLKWIATKAPSPRRRKLTPRPENARPKRGPGR